MGNDSLETKDKFCYLGNMISACGGAEESCIARIRCGWKKFRELLPLLTSRVLSLCVLKVECLTLVLEALFFTVVKLGQSNDLNRYERNDMMMVRWMCKRQSCENNVV